MLYWVFSFLILAIIAGFLGFSGLAVVSLDVARVLFGIFLFLFVITAIYHIMRGKAPPLPPA